MRTLQFALAATLALALGCRSNSGQVQVEQEARMLEDEVYHLEAQLDECCRAKVAAERENEDLRRQLAGGPGGGPSDYRAPATESPSRSRSPAPRLEPPTIELPEATDTPPANLMPGGEQPSESIPGDQEPAASRGEPAKLSINRRLTGGLDRDRTGGDEGIMVMVEPRDAQGRLVKAPGAVSVVVMDPAEVGEASRVARWDFQAHEFDDHFKRSAFGQGLKYELDWPGEQPKNRDLVLFVRYISDDGTKLTSDAPLSVRLASDSPREMRDDDRPSGEPRMRLGSRRVDDGPTVRQARDDRPQWSPHR